MSQTGYFQPRNYMPVAHDSRTSEVFEKDNLIAQLKSQIFELEQNEKNFSVLTQKFKNLQNE